jgi:hypothetical protein
MSAKCSTCGAEIVWVVTMTGSRMPVNAKTTKVFRMTGRTIAGSPEVEIVTAYTTHFVTCPQADQHRRKP